MGISKKRLKNIHKAEKRVSSKSKEKGKEISKLKHSQSIKESKAKASALTAKKRTVASNELQSDINSVDALFAKMGGDKDDEDAGSNGGASDSSDAGAFHDVGGSDDEEVGGALPHELDSDDDQSDSGAKHEEELASIKEKDPEFYKFLVEQDKSLLDFREPDEAAEGAEAPSGDEAVPEAAADLVVDAEKAPVGKLLDKERLKRIQESAKDSFTSCKAALNAYHIAIRSIEGPQEGQEAAGEDDEDEEEPSAKSRKSKKNKQKKIQRGLFRIEDEAIFSEVLEWCIANMLGLFKHHAGELQDSTSARAKKKGKKGKAPSLSQADIAAGLLDPTQYTRWARVQVMVRIFWEETVFLVNNLTSQQMLEFVLRHVSTPEALSWLWPFQSLRQRFFKRACNIWSMAPSNSVRLMGFLFLRNSAAMALHAPQAQVRDVPQLDSMLRGVLRSFAEVANLGYSWRSTSTFRFMENCLVELLRVDEASAYRTGYVFIRQLALVLRNACIAASQAGASIKHSGASEKSKKKKALQQQQAQNLIGWPFIRSIYLWTKAVSQVSAMQPLAYPLYMIIMGAVKNNLSKLQHFPFVYHCLQCLNRLGSQLEAFVPISSHLLKGMSGLMQAMDRAHKKRRLHGGGGGSLEKTKAPELEIILRLNEEQVSEVLVLEAIGGSLCNLMTDHLGLLSQSPAFPEIVAPVLMHLRRYSKHCKSEAIRRQLKTLVESADKTAEDIRGRRETLTEAPNFKKFLIFEADSVLAKARTNMLQRQAAEEKGRVEAEIRDEQKAEKKVDAKRKKEEGDDGAEEAPKAKKKKNQRLRAKEAAAKAAAAASAKKSKKSSKPLATTDTVEEMDFSSGED